jgi:hypothetical protein
MISDSVRFNAYAKAISRSVRAGEVVAEIGCGPAVFWGAGVPRRGKNAFYAIEAEDIIGVAKQIAAANSVAARNQSHSGVDCGRRGGALFAGSNGWKCFAIGNREECSRTIS